MALSKEIRETRGRQNFLHLLSLGKETDGVNAADFTIGFDRQVLASQWDYEVALEYMSWRPKINNVTLKNGYDSFNYEVAGVPKAVSIEPGQYTFETYVNAIEEGLDDNGHAGYITFAANEQTGHTIITVVDATTQVIFPFEHVLFGFDAQVLSHDLGVPHVSEAVADFLLGVRAVNVELYQAVAGVREGENDIYSIFTFQPQVDSITVEEIRPLRLEWHDLLPNTSFRKLRVVLSDQNGKPITLDDRKASAIFIKLVYRPYARSK